MGEKGKQESKAYICYDSDTRLDLETFLQYVNLLSKLFQLIKYTYLFQIFFKDIRRNVKL